MTGMTKIAAGAGVAVALIVIVLLKAWAITLIWTWFAVPLGLPQVGMAWATGLLLLVSLFQPVQSQKKKDPGDKPWDKFLTSIGTAIATPLLTVSLGWVAHSFMGAV